MFKDFINLVQSLNTQNKIILFCENENLYQKIFFNNIKKLTKLNFNIQVVTFKTNLTKKHLANNISYINFNNYDFLKVYFKLIKDKIIISSTPTINKSISNNSNYFIFIQHSLLRMSNKYTKDHINNFDLITVSSKDQEEECNNSLTINKNNIKRIKYHSLDFITENSIKKLSLNEKPILLIASSFYGNHIIKLIDENFIKELSKFYKIILRPHPEIYKDPILKKKIEFLKKRFNSIDFKLSNEASNKEIIDQSDYLITDFSGIALTYSYRKLTPSIFIIKDNSDRILLNDNYYESTLNKVGIIVEYNTQEVLKTLHNIKFEKNNYSKKINNFRNFQFKNFNNEINLENFILDKSSKII